MEEGCQSVCGGPLACAKACNGGGVFVSGRELQAAERSLQDCLSRLGPHDGLARWKTVIFSLFPQVPPALLFYPGLSWVSGCTLALRDLTLPFHPIFCSRGWGLCLDDSPAKDVIDFPSVLPGVLYDVNHQCRLQYGAYSVFCEDMDVSKGVGVTGDGPHQPESDRF